VERSPLSSKGTENNHHIPLEPSHPPPSFPPEQLPGNTSQYRQFGVHTNQPQQSTQFGQPTRFGQPSQFEPPATYLPAGARTLTSMSRQALEVVGKGQGQLQELNNGEGQEDGNVDFPGGPRAACSTVRKQRHPRNSTVQHITSILFLILAPVLRHD
jgi:hypothetical protein